MTIEPNPNARFRLYMLIILAVALVIWVGLKTYNGSW